MNEENTYQYKNININVDYCENGIELEECILNIIKQRIQ